jgi:hypothetical protein
LTIRLSSLTEVKKLCGAAYPQGYKLAPKTGPIQCVSWLAVHPKIVKQRLKSVQTRRYRSRRDVLTKYQQTRWDKEGGYARRVKSLFWADISFLKFVDKV